MDFLAFLVDELYKNGRIFIWEIPWKSLENSWHIWNIFGVTFEPETLETWSRALKTRILA